MRVTSGNLENVKSPTAAAADADYSSLFGTTGFDDDDDEPDLFYSSGEFDPSKSPSSAERRGRKASGSAGGATNQNYFGPTQAALLVKHLTHTHLPGLSSLDQMYMLALADTVANTRLDFTENTASDVAVKQG